MLSLRMAWLFRVLGCSHGGLDTVPQPVTDSDDCGVARLRWAPAVLLRVLPAQGRSSATPVMAGHPRAGVASSGLRLCHLRRQRFHARADYSGDRSDRAAHDVTSGCAPDLREPVA